MPETEASDNRLYGSEKNGFYRKRKDSEIYAMILPIPERLKIYASKKFGKRSCVEIESLLSVSFLDSFIEKREWEEDNVGGGKFLNFSLYHKKVIRENLFKATKEDFKDFAQIFSRVEELLLSSIISID